MMRDLVLGLFTAGKTGRQRLVEILPGHWERHDAVACSPKRAPLPGPGDLIVTTRHYIPYAWADIDPTDLVDVVINGNEHAVTRSLFTALERLSATRWRSEGHRYFLSSA